MMNKSQIYTVVLISLHTLAEFLISWLFFYREYE